MNKKSILCKTLSRALSMKRPHGTPAVVQFTTWLETHVPNDERLRLYYDDVGNLHVDTRTEDTHRTLFVAHVDTVHREVGANKIRKTKSMWYADGACLGADDGAGCAMLMHLMHAGVRGYYIFTQGEERGGIGAKYLADQMPDLLREFDRAVAFDRRGIDSVITHQGWGRCCSDDFAAGLSDALCADGVLMYLGDDTGVYTDTAEFTALIPECTNISVGYDNEHSDRETLDMLHFEALSQAVVKIDWDALPVVRDPLAIEPDIFNSAGDTNWRSYISTVGSTKWDGKWLDKWDDQAPSSPFNDEVEYLRDCIIDAKHGMYEDLLDLIADAAYPENADLARRYLSKRLLTDEVLDDALQACDAYGADTVLLSLFDIAHCEV